VRTTWILALLVACDAGEKPAPPVDLAAAPAAKQDRQEPFRSTPDLSYLPASSDLVLHIDVAALRNKTQWPTYEHDMERVLLPPTSCEGYQPIHEVTTVQVGVLLDAKRAVFVVRGLDRSKMLRCLHAKDGVVTVKRDDKYSDVLTFVDDRTMIVQRAQTTSTSDLSAALLAKSGPLQTVLADVEQRLPAKAIVTVVSRPGSAAIQKNWQIGGELKYVYGTLDSTPGHVRMSASMVLGTTADAAKLGATLAEQLKTPQVKQALEIFEATTKGDTVTMTIGMTDSQLVSIAGMLRSMMQTP
jgi:hypothetical protein